MRLWHTTYAVFVFAMMFTVAREPAGRVAIVIFITGLCVLVCTLTGLMLLFRTVGSLGEADGLFEAVQCAVATLVVGTVAAYIVVTLLGIGASLVQRVI